MKTVSAKEMRELEQNSKIHPDILMETAGRNVAQEIINEYLCTEREKKIIVLCGAGNNGGDGLVCARYLIEHGAEVYCYIVPSEKGYKELVMKNLKRAFFSHLSIKEIVDFTELEASLKEAFLVVDALLGTGFEGELKEPYKKIITLLNTLNKNVTAIDLPSGMNADTGAGSVIVRAKRTYALGFCKHGLIKKEAAEYVGKLEVLEIGL